jgi:hypothetical protein
MSMRITWNKNLSWPQPGARSCVTMPPETPAWRMGPTLLPLILMNSMRPTMSLISWCSRISSYRCIWLCILLSSDYLAVLIDTTCRTSVQSSEPLRLHASGLSRLPGFSWRQTRGDHTEAGKGSHTAFFTGPSVYLTFFRAFLKILLARVLREVNESGLFVTNSSDSTQTQHDAAPSPSC